MNVTVEDAAKIVDEMYEMFDIAEDEIDVRDKYSGRGMYGATTTGFVLDDSYVPYLFMVIGLLSGNDEIDLVLSDESFDQDSIGLRTIVY